MTNSVLARRVVLDVNGQTYINVVLGEDSYCITPRQADRLIKELTFSIWGLSIPPEEHPKQES